MNMYQAERYTDTDTDTDTDADTDTDTDSDADTGTDTVNSIFIISMLLLRNNNICDTDAASHMNMYQADANIDYYYN